CLSTFLAGGGLNLESTTTVELALTLGAGVAVAAAIAFAPAGVPVSGAWPIGLLFGLAALTAISVAWSVAPDASWQEAAQLLAYPAMGLLIVTLMLAYSRGALAAALLGAAVWLCLLPRRLRGASMLIVCVICAGAVVAFDFSSSALSSEAVALSRRVSAGHQL